ncbi:hypothetical protein B1218_32510, partial [Pseudomonas ogarae]
MWRGTGGQRAAREPHPCPVSPRVSDVSETTTGTWAAAPTVNERGTITYTGALADDKGKEGSAETGAVNEALDAMPGVIENDGAESLAVEQRRKMVVARFSGRSPWSPYHPNTQNIQSVGALLFVDMAHVAGLVAAGLTLIHCLTPTWSPPPPTRPCAVHVAA